VSLPLKTYTLLDTTLVLEYLLILGEATTVDRVTTTARTQTFTSIKDR
jgi:hypothetical protein